MASKTCEILASLTRPAPVLEGLAWHRAQMAKARAAADANPTTAATIERSEKKAAEKKAAELAAIDAELGEDGTVVLVSCSGPKLEEAAAAGDLYTSPLFKKARALAEATGQPWAILSGLHGLVDPATELAPYDCRLGALSASEKVIWNRKTRSQISNRWRGRATRFVVLAGADYAGAVADLPAVFPLAGLQVGERLREMNRLLAAGGLNNSEAI